MKSLTAFFSTPTGQLVLVGLLAVIAAAGVYWQRQKQPAAMPAAKTSTAMVMPKIFTREGARFTPPAESSPVSLNSSGASSLGQPSAVPAKKLPAMLPISLTPFAPAREVSSERFAPYGRLIPCETVLTIESNRLDTPVVGLVTADVWHDGRMIVPAGAEVHGRASTDRARERLAAQGAWTIVWRTPGAENGTELAVQGLALDRERDVAGEWGLHDGSAGLRGEVLRTNDWHEVELFAGTFLSTATAALQSTRTTATLLGEAITPAATVRNAALAGTSTVLRDYANQIRQAIERDGIYVRVPAGKPFYLYVTQTLDLGRAHRGPATFFQNPSPNHAP